MNEQDFIPQVVGVGDLQPGQVCLANEARFDGAFYDEPLTNYLVGGWDSDPLQELLEFYAPGVTVADRFHYKTFNHSEEFLRQEGDEDIRAMGAPFGKVEAETKNEVHDVLDEKGLTICVDVRELEGGDSMVEERRVERLRRILLRNELRRALAVLNAAAVNTNKTWDVSAGKDPDQDVSAELLVAENATGVRPNRVGYGSSAWSKRQLSFRAQNNAGGYASASMTPGDLAGFLMVETLAFGEARYRSSASALSTFIGNLVLMFQAATGLSEADPSNIKRFIGSIEGAPVRVYRREVGPRRVELTVAHKSKIKLTSTLGIRKFTVS